MAIRLPIVSEWDGRGLAKARRDIRNAEGFLGKAGAAARAFRGTLIAAGVAAAAAFGKIAADSVMLASDLDETKNKLNEVFGSGSGSLQENLKRSARELGQTRQQAYDAAATFGIFGKAAGLAGGDLVEFSEDLVRLSADFASFYNTSPEDAITAIGAALRSEAEPIRKYGVLLDAVTLKNRAMSLGIAEGNKPLTQQQKILAAQAEIFAQAGDAVGDFDRTQDGLANSIRQNKALFTELQTYFGEGLYEGLMTSADGLDTVEESLEGLGDTSYSVGSYLGGQFQKLGAQIAYVQRLTSGSDSLVDWFRNLADVNNEFTDRAIASRKALSGTVSAALEAGAAMRSAAGDAQALADGLDEVTNAAPKPSSAFYSAFGQLRKTDASRARRELEKLGDTLGGSGGGGGGGVNRATEENAEATKRAERAVEKYSDAVQVQVSRLEDAQEELRRVNNEAAEFSSTAVGFLKGGTAFADALKMDEEARAAAKESGESYAGTWYTALTDSLKIRKEAAHALSVLSDSLNAADTRGNELLMRELFSLDPAEANTIARELIANGTGPAIAAELSAYDLWAGDAGAAWAAQFYDEGIRGAQAQVDAIKTTLTGKLDEFYKAGRRMGQAVMDGYNSVIGSLPTDVRVPTNKAARSGSVVNVTVQAGIGDPIAIARQVESTLRTASTRTGIMR